MRLFLVVIFIIGLGLGMPMYAQAPEPPPTPVPVDVPVSATLSYDRKVTVVWEAVAGGTYSCIFRVAPLPQTPLHCTADTAWTRTGGIDASLTIAIGDTVEVRVYDDAGYVVGVGTSPVDYAIPGPLFLPMVG
jgi:hypothetical protein